MKGKNWINIILVLLIYMMVYNPPVFSINCIRILMIPTLLYLHMNRTYMLEYINMKKVTTLVLCISIIFIYCIFIAIINANPVTNFTYLFYWIFGDIPFAIAVYAYIKKRGQGFDSIINHIIAAGALMSLSAIMALIFPQVKNYFTQRMLAYGVAYADRLSVYRNYGFAANLTSFTSMLQSVIAVICIHKAVEGKKLYLLVFPSIALSAIINTRSSILFILFGILIELIIAFTAGKASHTVRYILVIFGVLFASGYGIGIIQKYNPDTFTWLSKGYSQIYEFVSGSDRSAGYFGELQDMTVNSLPKGVNFFMGVGTSVMGGSIYGARSDVGFVNDIWKGGVFYSLIIICSFFAMIKQISRCEFVDKYDIRFYSVYFIVIFVLTNIKGSFFIHSDLTVVFWLIYTATVLTNDNKSEFRRYVVLRSGNQNGR